jgi:hypothetical protein
MGQALFWRIFSRNMLSLTGQEIRWQILEKTSCANGFTITLKISSINISSFLGLSCQKLRGI